LVTLALDPGLASMGIAAVAWTGKERPMLLQAQVLTTKKAKKKALQQIRVATDDMRRIRALWVTVQQWLDKYLPAAVGIEGYSPIPGQQGGGSWKVNSVTYAMVGLCWSRGIEPVIMRPSDLRAHFLDRQYGTKLDIECAVTKAVHGVSEFLLTMSASNREHVADAIGYAVLAYAEMERIRTLAGLTRQGVC
jgi:Holliday junction resolvasome RuvABC endonuclease subunit